MKYNTPELQLVGAAQGLVLGAASGIFQDCLKYNELDSVRPFSRDTPDI